MGKQTRKKRVSRIFSEEVRRHIVHEYEQGQMSARELCKFYEISSTSLYNWINKYSKFAKKSLKIVEMAKSKEQYIKELEARISNLERAVGQKQMKIDFLEKLIELAKEEYQVDIKKNYATGHSAGSETTKQP